MSVSPIKVDMNACVCAKSLQSCPTLCDPMDCSLPDSSVYGILQARILEWVAMALLQQIFPTQGSNPHLMSPVLAGGFFTTSITWKAQICIALVYSFWQLCNIPFLIMLTCSLFFFFLSRPFLIDIELQCFNKNPGICLFHYSL